MTDERILWITNTPKLEDYFVLQEILKRKGYEIELRNPETALEGIAPECEGVELIVVECFLSQGENRQEDIIERVRAVYTGKVMLYVNFWSNKARDEALKRTGADYAFNGRFVPVDFPQILEAIFGKANKTKMPGNLVSNLA